MENRLKNSIGLILCGILLVFSSGSTFKDKGERNTNLTLERGSASLGSDTSLPWKTEFNDPPMSSRPLTWWHWMNGNINKDGITRDLEWMKEFGLSGAIVFNTGRLPDDMPRMVKFDTPEWWGMVDHAIAEANRLGLKLGFHNCDGWSHSGGPWNSPEESMKKLVWTETLVSAGNQDIVLEQPETIQEFYRDIAIMALPVQNSDPTHATELIDDWGIKAGHQGRGNSPDNFNSDRQRFAKADPGSAIASKSIVNLSAKLGADNKLDWTPPPGHWRIMRIGYTTTGKTNHPSTVEGRGLETDKFDAVALRRHWGKFMGRLASREVNQGNNTFAYTQIDSWEAGIQNWTGQMEAIFREFNGYDMKPYLPVLAGGHIVGSYEISERFLWDFRKTIAHLILTGSFQTLSGLAAADGLATISEGSGRGQYMYDPINYQSAAPIPQGEFWGSGGSPRIDCKIASSVAHIYGGQLAASESFTGGTGTWNVGPGDLKGLGDQAFALGINTMVLHTSAHQPYSHLKPGFSLTGAGTHFHRNNIVFAQSNAWPHYLSRCQYLLRKGLYVADVLHFTGEDVPNFLGFRNELPVPLPEGYEYDGCNADILFNHAQVDNGDIVLNSGMRYRVLLLPDKSTMSLKLLSRVQKLVSDGAIIVGPKPQDAPGLRDYPIQGQKVRKIAAQLWGECDGVTVKEHRYGKGKVIWGKSFGEIFAELDLKPDFSFETEGGKTPVINYIHRQDKDFEIYFVANAEPIERTIQARFRVSGNKVPHLYLPDCGKIISIANYQKRDGFIEVPLSLDTYGSVFVVFTPGESHRTITSVEGAKTPMLAYGLDKTIEAEFFAPGKYQLNFSDGSNRKMEIALPVPINVDGLWDIRFPMTKEKPVKTLNSRLFSWTESDDADIRYFSGTAVYSKTFNLPKGYRTEGQKLYIDLGEVQKIAILRVNGKRCPDIWKAPYRAEITNLLATGLNRIEVEVTNTLTNRMIGDAHLPPDLQYDRDLSALPEWLDGSVERKSERQTFTLREFFDKNDPLQPSGLLGPVTIKATAIQTIADH